MLTVEFFRTDVVGKVPGVSAPVASPTKVKRGLRPTSLNSSFRRRTRLTLYGRDLPTTGGTTYLRPCPPRTLTGEKTVSPLRPAVTRLRVGRGSSFTHGHPGSGETPPRTPLRRTRDPVGTRILPGRRSKRERGRKRRGEGGKKDP